MATQLTSNQKACSIPGNSLILSCHPTLPSTSRLPLQKTSFAKECVFSMAYFCLWWGTLHILTLLLGKDFSPYILTQISTRTYSTLPKVFGCYYAEWRVIVLIGFVWMAWVVTVAHWGMFFTHFNVPVGTFSIVLSQILVAGKAMKHALGLRYGALWSMYVPLKFSLSTDHGWWHCFPGFKNKSTG